VPGRRLRAKPPRFGRFPPDIARAPGLAYTARPIAGVAQLVEQSLRKREVGGSSPSTGTIFHSPKMLAIALLLWLQTALPITNDDGGTSRTFTKEMEVSVADLPPGTWKWMFCYILIPSGCEHAKHEVEVLEAIPELPSGVKNLVYDSAHSGPNYHPDGWSAVAQIGIAAHRDHALPSGPATTKVRVRLTANCSDSAYEKLQQKFLIDKLDFT
jgi:hypothetical protein